VACDALVYVADIKKKMSTLYKTRKFVLTLLYMHIYIHIYPGLAAEAAHGLKRALREP
jgi:hypothetical protein